MIDKRVYGLDYIRELQQKYVSDPGLIERALYAFGLLEAIKSVGMPFCFKGGTSLMLILEKPARLSTDIDILVKPGTDVDDYIEKASRIFPFLNWLKIVKILNFSMTELFSTSFPQSVKHFPQLL